MSLSREALKKNQNHQLFLWLFKYCECWHQVTNCDKCIFAVVVHSYKSHVCFDFFISGFSNQFYFNL